MSDAKRTIGQLQPNRVTAIQNLKVAGGQGNFLFQTENSFVTLLCTRDSIPCDSKVNASELQA